MVKLHQSIQKREFMPTKNDISIVILAAGKGSRMKSQKAKVLHSISSKPMIYYIIKAAQEISNDISVVIGHQKQKVQEEISNYFENINFVEQDIQNYPGTGGALKGVKPQNEKVLVLNGDMPLINFESLEGFIQNDADIILSVFDLEDPSGYGRVVIQDNEVQKIVEQKDASKEELQLTTVNAGVYAFSKTILEKYLPKLNNNNAQKEYYLTDIISLARAENCRIMPLLVDEEHFMGVNSKIELAHAEMLMQKRLKEYWMAQGVIMQLPETIYLEDTVVFEGECIIENNCRLSGKTLLKDSHIKAGSVIEESTIIASDIGPLAHIRPKSEIINTHIGNFVEVKKSKLNGVKAGHLSYLGDAIINSGTNIGAGVITCNYDGIKKYETKIGKNVFVGSDSQLVAPLEIEDDVMIAAGTTLTSGEVKKGSLAISRTKLRFVKDFYYKFFGKR